MRRALAALLLVALTSCVYYNGMYNTKRLAEQAERADRDDRTFEATGLWGQVSAKADSVVLKHPTSRWADEARLLRGTALARLGDCPTAVGPLERVMLTAKSTELAERAALIAGSCRVIMADALGAMAAYNRLAASRNASRRAFALYAQGRTLNHSGAHEEGYERLVESTHPQARGERAAALAGSGRLEEAVATTDSLLGDRDSLAPWDSLVTWMRRHDPEAAANLTGRVAAESGLPLAVRVRLLLRDAEFWLPSDSTRGATGFAQAIEAGGGTPLGNESRAAAAIAYLRLVDDLEQLRKQGQELEEMVEIMGARSGEVSRLALMAQRVASAADSVPPGAPAGELRLFIAAELARDSLGSARFAAAVFRRIVADWVDSPYAAKALFALMALEPENEDSLRSDLELRYSANPYVVLAGGGEAPAYVVLEDSLRRVAQRFRPGGRRPVAPRPGQPAQPVRPPAEQDQPAQPVRPVDR